MGEEPPTKEESTLPTAGEELQTEHKDAMESEDNTATTVVTDDEWDNPTISSLSTDEDFERIATSLLKKHPELDLSGKKCNGTSTAKLKKAFAELLLCEELHREEKFTFTRMAEQKYDYYLLTESKLEKLLKYLPKVDEFVKAQDATHSGSDDTSMEDQEESEEEITVDKRSAAEIMLDEVIQQLDTSSLDVAKIAEWKQKLLSPDNPEGREHMRRMEELALLNDTLLKSAYVLICEELSDHFHPDADFARSLMRVQALPADLIPEGATHTISRGLQSLRDEFVERYGSAIMNGEWFSMFGEWEGSLYVPSPIISYLDALAYQLSYTLMEAQLSGPKKREEEMFYAMEGNSSGPAFDENQWRTIKSKAQDFKSALVAMYRGMLATASRASLLGTPANLTIEKNRKFYGAIPVHFDDKGNPVRHYNGWTTADDYSKDTRHAPATSDLHAMYLIAIQLMWDKSEETFLQYVLPEADIQALLNSACRKDPRVPINSKLLWENISNVVRDGFDHYYAMGAYYDFQGGGRCDLGGNTIAAGLLQGNPFANLLTPLSRGLRSLNEQAGIITFANSSMERVISLDSKLNGKKAMAAKALCKTKQKQPASALSARAARTELPAVNAQTAQKRPWSEANPPSYNSRQESLWGSNPGRGRGGRCSEYARPFDEYQRQGGRGGRGGRGGGRTPFNFGRGKSINGSYVENEQQTMVTDRVETPPNAWHSVKQERRLRALRVQRNLMADGAHLQ